jgi:hypothetical protein
MQHYVFVWVAIILLLLGIASLGLCYYQKRCFMNKEVLIEVAKEYARQRGRAIEDYTVLSIETDGGKHWVHFQGKSGLPGDHFTVLIDAATREAIELIPGS